MYLLLTIYLVSGLFHSFVPAFFLCPVPFSADFVLSGFGILSMSGVVVALPSSVLVEDDDVIPVLAILLEAV